MQARDMVYNLRNGHRSSSSSSLSVANTNGEPAHMYQPSNVGVDITSLIWNNTKRPNRSRLDSWVRSSTRGNQVAPASTSQADESRTNEGGVGVTSTIREKVEVDTTDVQGGSEAGVKVKEEKITKEPPVDAAVANSKKTREILTLETVAEKKRLTLQTIAENRAKKREALFNRKKTTKELPEEVQQSNKNSSKGTEEEIAAIIKKGTYDEADEVAILKAILKDEESPPSSPSSPDEESSTSSPSSPSPSPTPSSEPSPLDEATKEKLRHERGLCARWYGLRESQKVKKSFTKTLSCVAIGDDKHVFLYEDGSWSFSSGLPEKLHNLLAHRAPTHPAPEYVAMGSWNRFYIRFKGNNRKAKWSGPAVLTRELLHPTRIVRSVAFGVEFDTFFVVYEDGSYEWGGNIPNGLLTILLQRRKNLFPKKVTLGPNGEWSLWTEDGGVWVGNCGYALSNAISPLNGTLTDIHFGAFGAFFIRYNDEPSPVVFVA